MYPIELIDLKRKGPGKGLNAVNVKITCDLVDSFFDISYTRNLQIEALNPNRFPIEMIAMSLSGEALYEVGALSVQRGNRLPTVQPGNLVDSFFDITYPRNPKPETRYTRTAKPKPLNSKPPTPNPKPEI
jgi:hypothetical protein